MCFGGGDDNTTTTTQKYVPDPNVRGAGQWAINNMWDLVRRYQDRDKDYPTRKIAGFTPDQLQAFGAIRNDYDYWRPAYDRAGSYATNAARRINKGDVNSYLNPWADYALAGLNEDIGVQTRDLSGRMAQATGGVGADRIAVGLGEKNRQDQLARGQLMSGFWEKALGAAEQEKARQANAANQWMQIGSNGLQSALTGDQALYTSGAAQQGLKQQQLDAKYLAAMQNFKLPFELNDYLTKTVGGLAGALGGTQYGTQTYPQPSPWGAIAGLGMTGLGLMTGNPGMSMSGLKGMTSGGGGGSGWMGNTGYHGWLQPGMADGGAVDGEADGGAVNPWDTAQGFAFGGAPWTDMIGLEPDDQTGFFGQTAEPPPAGMPNWAPGIGFSMNNGPGFPDPKDLEAPPLPPTPQAASPYMMADPLAPKVPTGAPVAAAADGDVLPPMAKPTGPAQTGITPPPAAYDTSSVRAASPIPAAPDPDSWMPRKPDKGKLSDRLLEAGLTMLAHYGDRDSRGLPAKPLATIGKGGLAALEGQRKDVTSDQKNIELEQKSKALADAAKKWRASLDETSRGHDLLAEYRESESSRKLAADQQRGLSGNWKPENYTRNGERGVLWTNQKTMEQKFVPGASLSGRMSESSSFLDRAISRLMENGMTYDEALAKAKQPNFAAQERSRAEARATANARAHVGTNTGQMEDYSEVLERYRALEGLPAR